MKLLNKSLIYLSVSLFFIIGIWSVVFYFNMLNEIKESVDEGLDNYKRQIIYEAEKDRKVLLKNNFDEGFFAIQEISQKKALSIKDTYIDTLMYMQDADDESPELEPVRMLTTAFEHNEKVYKLRIINSMVEEDDLVKELVYDTVWLYLILILIIIIINNFVLKRLWKPFYSLLNQLKNYRIGYSKNLPEVKTETKEFADLQQAVNVLLHHTIETYEQQKSFIGNASHELQTPLAIALNKLELLIENENLKDNQAESIANVMQIIGRLVRLNKSLLLLTKIENKQFLNNQNISLNEAVNEIISDLSEITEYKNIEFVFTETSQVNIEIDGSLLNILLSNLLRNAIFHNVENGKVNINVSTNSIEIINTGIEMAIDPQKIFSRFYKSNTATNGSGLGLAIVKAICDLYGFTILYRFKNSLHTFEINFK